MSKRDANRDAGDSRRGGGFLRRLRDDVRGNTLAIVGAALVPLCAMIGSGVDMSRAYMAKTRLQSACDAAALAGRRVMIDDQLSTAVTTEANRFFNFNFAQRMYQTETFTPVVTRPAAGTVRVTATTRIPTTIMSMFGFTTLPLNVTCDASLNFVNTDVMMVLDVTGSMLQDVNGNNTGTVANQKITALQDAVMALYDELTPVQAQLESNGLRLRYGIVPYSSAVNVGRLISGAVPVPAGGGLPGSPAYLRDSAPYQTRTGNYSNYGTNTLSDTGNVSETYGSTLTSASCTEYQTNVGYPTLNGSSTSTGTAPNPVTTVSVSARDWGGTGTTSGTSRTCRRYKRTRETQTGYRSTGWTYREATIDTSQYKLGNPVTVATDDDGVSGTSNTQVNLRQIADLPGASTTSVSWNGCIEERDTTSTITGSSTNTIPNNAWDLDINRIPNNDGSRWRPHWPRVVYTRSAGSTTASSGSSMFANDDSFYACPSEARRLQAWTRAAMLSYVNALEAIGGTYHDIGMIWGARMISDAGIFADSPGTFNSMPVARHVIFMTDGQLAPNCNSYSSYGVEQNDMRVTGGGSCPQQLARHLQRFRMICEATKSMNVSIWVIAFGTTLSQDMIDCASNANQASTSTNRAQLIARFREIGNNIGALRLTQ